MALFKINAEDVIKAIKVIEAIEQDCKPNRIAYVLRHCIATGTPVIGCQCEYDAVISNSLGVCGIKHEEFISIH
jgi:hypothetical protein